MAAVLRVVDGEWEALGASLSSLSEACSSMIASRDPKLMLARALPGAASVVAAQAATDRYVEHRVDLGQSLRSCAEAAVASGHMFDETDNSIAETARSIGRRWPARVSP